MKITIIYRIITVILAVSMLLPTYSYPLNAETPMQSASEQPFDAPDEYSDICSVGGLTMQYSGFFRAVRLVDTASGEVKWNSIVTKEIFDTTDSTKTWKNLLSSVLSIMYSPANDTRGNSSLACSAEDTVNITTYLIKNGIRIDMDFTAAKISLSMRISLTENGVEVSLPFEYINEYGDNYLLTADVFPYFGAAPKDSDGYIFYPDGSGALSYFSKTDEKPLYTENMVLDIYASFDAEKLLDGVDNISVMLPVYGIKNENQAFLAAITKGDCNAKICVNTAVNTSAVPINSASFRFVFRNEYRLYLSNISSSQTNSKEQSKYGIKREKELLEDERTVRFFLLEGDDADYSGMANVYREYLIDSGTLSKSLVSDKNALFLTMFMGDRKQDTFFKSFVETCDFEDAYEIIGNYINSGVSNLQVRLRGWSNDGYGSFPQKLRPAWKLGGKKGLRFLDTLAKDKDLLSLYLELNVTDALAEAGGFSKKRDVIVKGNSIPVSDEPQEVFLLSANKSLSLFEKAKKKLSYIKNTAFSLQSIGNAVYSNAYKNKPHTRLQAAEIFSKMAKGNSVQGGNLYLLSSAAHLTEIPFEASMHVNTDISVPFYQMVVYGSVPYGSQPGNLFYDLEEIKLKWIEYGYVPSFEITSRSTSALKETSYNQLFTAKNSKWESKILDIYYEFSQKLSPVKGAYMTKHESVSDNVYRVEYSNGWEIYINYNTESVLLGDIEIAAQNYLIREAVE